MIQCNLTNDLRLKTSPSIIFYMHK